MPRLREQDGAEPSAASRSYNYDGAFARAESRLEKLFDSDLAYSDEPAALFAQLELLSPEEQTLQVAAEERFASAGLVPLLIDASHRARYNSPEQMLHAADLARLVADACANAGGHGRRIEDLRAGAWGQYSSALRVMGRLRDAEEAMTLAHAALAAGTGDSLVRARLYALTASLRTYQRHFDSASELIDEAIAIFEAAKEEHALAGALIQKAVAAIYAADPERAVGLLDRAIPLIDYEEDPDLLLTACHNLVRCYIDLDQPEQALSLYTEAQGLYQELDNSYSMLRTTWQEGLLLRSLGRLSQAETALLRARKGFMERNLSYEVAVVSLDLATVYVQLGIADQVRKAVAEALPIFRSLRVDRETLASLLQLQKVADQESQALGLIRTVAARLEKVPHRTPDPDR